MATKSTKKPPREYTVAERLAISQQRERLADAQQMLRDLGALVDIESDNPMDDVSYEQRNCRMKALDLAVETIKDSAGYTADGLVKDWAQVYYDYIWEGKIDATV